MWRTTKALVVIGLALRALAACSSSTTQTGDGGDGGDGGTPAPTGDAGIPYDAGLTACDGGGSCFSCEQTTCPEGTYCESITAGYAAAVPNGTCKPLPAPCASMRDCQCLGVNAGIFMCSYTPECFDDGAGHTMLKCKYY